MVDFLSLRAKMVPKEVSPVTESKQKDIVAYIDKRIYEISGMNRNQVYNRDTGCYETTGNWSPRPWNGGVSKVSRGLRKEYSEKRKPVEGSNKYVPISDRKKHFKKKERVVGKAIIDFFEKQEYKLNISNGGIGNLVKDILREAMKVEGHSEAVKHNICLESELKNRYQKFETALLNLEGDILCGTVENPIKAFKEIEETKW